MTAIDTLMTYLRARFGGKSEGGYIDGRVWTIVGILLAILLVIIILRSCGAQEVDVD